MDILCVLVLVPKVNLKLDPGSYTFYVSALTSGGEGDHETLGWTIEKPSMYEDIELYVIILNIIY